MTPCLIQTEEGRVRELLDLPRWTDEEYHFLREFLRFTNREKEEVRERVDIEQLLAGLGITFPSGKRTPQVRCFMPSHQEKSPSMTLYRRNNRCFCFGCRASLTPVEVLVQFYGRPFPEAMDFLLGDCLNAPRQLLRREIKKRFEGKGAIPPPPGSISARPLPKPAPAGEQRAKLLITEALRAGPKVRQPEVQSLLEAAVSQYQAELADCPPARDFLKDRGLSEETIFRHRLGYSGGVWLSGWLRQLGQDLGLAHQVGLLGEGTRERLAGRIILPYLNSMGEILHLTGRYLFSSARARELLGLPVGPDSSPDGLNNPKYLGLTLPKPPLEDFIPSGQEYLLLVEGPFDWLVARQWGSVHSALTREPLTWKPSKQRWKAES